MSLKLIGIPFIAAAGVAVGLAVTPVADASVDPCRSAVSTSRCLGPQGIDGFQVPNSGGGGAQNGPYGSWGGIPPIG